MRDAPNDMFAGSDAEPSAAERTARELALLYEVSRDLGSSLDLDDVLDALLDASLRLAAAPLGYVVLRDRESGTQFLRCTRGIGHAAARGRRSSIADWVLEQGRPLVVNASESNDASGDSVTGAAAAVGVPLVSAAGVIGVVVVADDATDRHFGADEVRLLATAANHGASAVANAELYASLQEAYLTTVRSLAAAIDAKDTYTRGHSDRVARLAGLVGEWIGLSHDQLLALELAAYLHDIGKIGIAEGVLRKPGRLDEVETEQMHEHPLIGATILEPVSFPWEITPIVRHHHERWDGSGYPAGLAGDEIPLLARIMSVADSHEAMVSERPYRAGMSERDALAELRRCAGTQFDERIVHLFCEAMRQRGIDDTSARQTHGRGS